MKRISSSFVILLSLWACFALSGCSGDSRETETASRTDTPETPVGNEMVTVQDTIEFVVNEAVARLRLLDKSGLYDNEFEYMREGYNFDEYLKLRQLQFARADSLSYLEIVNLVMYDHDSAEAALTLHFDGPTNVHHKREDTITVYFHNGEWIKPTASNIKEQIKYDEERGKTSIGL